MIGVCIKYFHANYGGMLQAYATTAILEDMGLQYELIQYEKHRTPVEIIKAMPRLLNSVLLNDKYESLLQKLGEKLHPEFATKNIARKACFAAFCEERFTKLSPVFKGYPALCEGAQRYDAVITGSDQLWSPAGLPTNYYNLMFVPDEIRKVSFASSFGVSNIPWYQKKRTKEFLNRIPYVSMRENRGAQIVKDLTGRDVPVLMDPVFYFNKQDWEKLIPYESNDWGQYIFCYFLGNNPEHRKAARRLSEETGLKIVTLRHLDRYVPEDETFGDIAPYDVDPAKFLNILRNAAYVCTDSFHGSVFSIIHEKKFMVFNRYSSQSVTSKNSRIDSLCQNLGISDRRYSGMDDIRKKMESDIQYDAIQKRLSEERSRTKQYLEAAIR